MYNDRFADGRGEFVQVQVMMMARKFLDDDQTLLIIYID